MKRRALSFIIALALCLNLCPVWGLAAGGEAGGGPCPHHLTHTDTCGYVPPVPEQACTHSHGDDCYTTETNCVHEHTAECYPASESDPEGAEPALCAHVCTEESGCVTRTLSCRHSHDDTCGYVPGEPGAPCTYVCRICPIEELIGELPPSVSPSSSGQVQACLDEIFALYDELTPDEQQQLDLSPCAALLEQIDGMAAEVLSTDPVQKYILGSDETIGTAQVVDTPYIIDTREYTLTGLGASAVQVAAGGELELQGTVVATKGIGVQVESGGSLRITGTTYIEGSSYALDVVSGADVRLSTGKYFGKKAAIRTAGDFASLLSPNCAFFDESGSPILLSDLAAVRTVVVGQCAGHSKDYDAHVTGATSHTWRCLFCGTEQSEQCDFTFDTEGRGVCACGSVLTIVVDESDLTGLVYDGTIQAEDVKITVALADGSADLRKDTDYKVEYEPRKDAGEIKVTVTGVTFTGTFTRTYRIEQDQPGIRWDASAFAVDYDSEGRPVDSAVLPHITITIKAPNDEDLHPYLRYAYKKDGDTEFTEGLPVNAGEYQLKAYLPESNNYKAAETDPCLALTINKIDALIDAPVPTRPTYDGNSHELVTAGAVRRGAVIEYALAQAGPYSADIPTGVHAGGYAVWYRIADTENYTGRTATEVPGVEILRKPITPDVVLSEYTYLYDGGYKQPKVTVRDEDHVTVLPDTEYQVAYQDNRNVGTAKVVVTDQPGGDYALEEVEVPFQITSRTQETLSITGKPNTVTYGDKFTLGTSGGSDSGEVTWEITEGRDVAQVDPKSGQITVVGHGAATVRATKSGGNNYEDATDSWPFTADKRPVTATVTAEDRPYDGSRDAVVRAVVEQGVLPGDKITITGLAGLFSDENAGADKAVTVTGAAVFGGTNWEHYEISCPVDDVRATISKAVVEITAPPDAADLVYSGTAQELIAAPAEVGVAGVQVEYALSEEGPYLTNFPRAADAGAYTVWYRVQETGNYTGRPPRSVEAAIAPKPVTPTVALAPASPVYDGTPREPAVTLAEADGPIPAGAYTVAYSDNVNAGTATVTVTAKDGGNYAFAPVTEPFTIQPKTITPTIALSESSYVYDGSKKEPKITVRDDKTVLEEDQYQTAWDNDLTSAGTHTLTVSKAAGKNYTFDDVTAVVTIVEGVQGALKITGKPAHVCYGDTVTTLDTQGGVGNGAVEWSITAGGANSEIDRSTGRLTVRDIGSITVTAKRTVPNYGTVTDDWTFAVEPKPVTAEVTVAPKVYDGLNSVAAVTAGVKAGDLVDPAGDAFTISGLTGTYDDVNAGTGKTVTLNDSLVTTTADAAKYAVSFPAAARADITPRPVTVSVTLSGSDLRIDDADGTYYCMYDGTEKTPAAAAVGSDAGGYSAPLAESDYGVSYAGNRSAGRATVTVTAKAGGNYTFADATANFTIKSTAAELTSTPQAKDLTYNGQAQDLVSVGTAEGGKVVYARTETGSYSEKIPQETDAGTYTVYYKVKGDENHDGTEPGYVSVTIRPKAIDASAITLSPDAYTYDGQPKEPKVTVKDGDAITIPDGEYAVSYQNNINAGIATVTVSAVSGSNYAVNGAVTFRIAQAAAVLTAPPEAKTGLYYTGEVRELIKAGVTGDGTVVYAVNGGNYSAAIPASAAVGDYAVTYKVLGDANHSDTAPADLGVVKIEKNTVKNPTIWLSSDTFRYNGSQQQPVITVYDDGSRLIPGHEYVVSIAGTNGNVGMVDVDTYTVTITTPSASNYVIANDGTVDNTRTFTITAANQETISITGTQARVRYGDAIQLGTTGGSGSGTITWTVTGGSTISPTGLLTVKDVGGPIRVTVTCSAGGNYTDVSAAWEFTAEKKPVTAVLTAENRDYADGGDTTVVHAAVPGSQLVPGDSIAIGDLTGTFDDANVGTNKRLRVDSSSPAVTGTNWEKYEIACPAYTTASILAVSAAVDTDPAPVSPLIYDAGRDQALVTAGTATGGLMVYSLDGTNYTQVIPRARNAGKYTVYFKAQGDGNHTDSEERTVDVTIGRQPVTPRIELTPPTAQYDGSVKRPKITVRDAANNVIPESEYKPTYVSDSGENWTDKGGYTVRIEDIPGGNYDIGTATETFTISTTPQNPLEIVNKPGLVYYGDTFTLSATGGSVSAAVTWSSSDDTVAHVDEGGLVTIRGTGPATITAEKAGGANYDTVRAAYPLNALQKPVTAVVTAEDRTYASGDRTAAIHFTWNGLVGTDTIDTSALRGEFADDSAGTDKTVTITGGPLTSDKYVITYNATTTASILKADAAAPVLTGNDREYDGVARALVTGGDADTRYSDARDGVYIAAVPTGTGAGTYTVWYRAEGDANHNSSQPQSLQVTIRRRPLTASAANTTLTGNGLERDDTDGTYYYLYDGAEKQPGVVITDGAAVVPSGEYTLSYSGNRDVGSAAVTITDSGDGNYRVSGSVDFAIRRGSAQLTGSPRAKELTYTGSEQELVTVGTAEGGHVEYALDGVDWGRNIPRAKEAGTYTVTYRVVGDDNHSADAADSTTSGSVAVTIRQKRLDTPKITVAPGPYTYTGSAHEPAVTVEDVDTLLPAGEYAVSYRNNIDAGTATVVVTSTPDSNYILNATAAFEIDRADLPAPTAPEGLKNLPYSGAGQALIKPGSASVGTMVYALSETGEYTPAIPTGREVQDPYTVWYKVLGDDNYKDSEPQSVTASIVVNAVTEPSIQVTPDSATFSGEKQRPAVTVRDDRQLLIDGSEYTVSYTDAGGSAVDAPVDVGTYTLTITGKTGGNYTFNTADGKNTAVFTISPAGQTPLTITGKRDQVRYGDRIPLDTEGGNGTVTWSVDNAAMAEITPDGLLTIKGVGTVTVTATSSAAGYDDQTAVWRPYAEKRPVTAVVTAAARPYDGGTDAVVTASLQDSDLVEGDTVTITLGGSFEDPNVGTDKKVTLDRANAEVTGKNSENYAISYPASVTASILRAEVTDVTAPKPAGGLIYTGDPLPLVEAGASSEGTVEYSRDNITYSAALPTETDAGDYDVWYRVRGDGNHSDLPGKKLDVQVTIARQTVTDPIIVFTPGSASYDAQEHRPAVTVMDGGGRVISEDEYTVDYGATDWTQAGKHTVTIADKDPAGGNYDITGKSEDFTITPMGQNPLTIGNQPGRVQYGDTFTLTASGGSGTGSVTWVSKNPDVARISDGGTVEILKSGGPVEIVATKAADGNHAAATASWTFSAEKKPVTPVVTARDRTYDTTDRADLDITWRPGDLLNGDAIHLDGLLTGRFDSADAGTGKTVRITGTAPDSDKYAITIPLTATASITPAPATAAGVTGRTGLTYTGRALALVTEGTATGGSLLYSLDGVSYDMNVPRGTAADTYNVWYKVQAGENYRDSAPARVTVTIDPKTVSSPVIELSRDTFDYDGDAKRPDVVVKDGATVIPTDQYTVSYSDNTAPGTATVTISPVTGGNYVVTGSKNFTIKAATASLKDAPQPNSLTYNGFAQQLVTPGTAVNGRVVYAGTESGPYSTAIPRGDDADTYQVWYKVEGENGAADTTPCQMFVTIQPMQVTPTILLENQAAYSTPCTGSAIKPAVTVVVNGQQLTGSYTTGYSNNTNVGTATVTVQSTGGNYKFFAVATFEITKGKATFFKEPEAIQNLVYTGDPQALVKKGFPEHPDDGIVLYSLDAGPYSSAIPTATEKGSYMVLAKVQGNAAYEDSDVLRYLVEIGINEVQNPTVELSAVSFNYTGASQKPTVTLSDDDDNVIPTGEYKVTYTGDTVNPGQYTLTITSREKNYSFEPIQRTITIVGADQPLLSITGKPDAVYYGDTLSLGVTGGSGSGAVTWTAAGPVDTLSAGQFRITSSGSVTITATKAASPGYEAASDTWTFYASPKPVTAVVTAASKSYDGNNTAVLTVAISSGLVGGDSIPTNTDGGVKAQGHFADANVGTDKIVVIDSLTVPPAVSAKYAISPPDTVTASITPKAAAVTDPPKAVSGLTYTGSPLALVSGGTVDGGTLAYSLDGVNYSLKVPTGTDRGDYTVWYKAVAGDENHRDSAPAQIGPVPVSANIDTPTVLCVGTFQCDGTEKTPTVVVRDSAGRVIPESEYTVALPSPRIAVGTYTVTVTDNPGSGNYEFAASVTGAFEIVAASQNPLSITDKPANICYGDTFRLSAIGGSGGGAIKWSIAESTGVAEIDDNGVVKVTGTGGFTVEAYREAEGGYSRSNTDRAPFFAGPKPVTPVVTAEDKPYDGNKNATVKAAWRSGDLVGTDTIALTVAGEFVTADAGTGKQVKITSKSPEGAFGNYVITWPESAAASIHKVDAKLETKPAARPNLTYSGDPQDLVTGGTTSNGIGTIVYSLRQDGDYSETIPQADRAGEYTVWYKVADSVNHTGIAAASVKVEIAKAKPVISSEPEASNGTKGQSLSEIGFSVGGAASVDGRFAWKDGTIKPAVGTTQQDVVFTPSDTDNYEKVEFQIRVTVSDSSSTPGGGTSTSGAASTPATAGAPLRATVQNGTASTVVSPAAGSRLVREAAESQSPSIIIKPEITGDVTRAEVSIPTSTVGQIRRETDAALTVSAPIADVTIPQTAMDTLSRGSGAISVATEQTDQAVVLTLTAGGERVDSVPGGVTLSIPAEDAGPGTVAVLVHEDGARETIRKSVAEDGKVTVPLEGSATVEIVDNGREFADVPATNWAADAVAFTSARELFNGTGDTTFSPNQEMSRGMLTTVLYNLEGQPDRDLTVEDLTAGFSDVSGDAWYADSVAWAAESGIVNGYGNGEFGPGDSITREQFAVMLWKYAGSPAADSQSLDFTDADKASGYAEEALRWAADNGILNGYGNGQLNPRGTATRAEAAQMLKNFLENT